MLCTGIGLGGTGEMLMEHVTVSGRGRHQMPVSFLVKATCVGEEHNLKHIQSLNVSTIELYMHIQFRKLGI